MTRKRCPHCQKRCTTHFLFAQDGYSRFKCGSCGEEYLMTAYGEEPPKYLPTREQIDAECRLIRRENGIKEDDTENYCGARARRLKLREVCEQ